MGIQRWNSEEKLDHESRSIMDDISSLVKETSDIHVPLL